MTPSITAQTTARLSVPTPSIHSGSNKIVHSTVTNVEVRLISEAVEAVTVDSHFTLVLAELLEALEPEQW